MSVTSRKVALDSWWEHFSTADRALATQAARDGSHLPDQLLPGLLDAGVFARAGT